MIDRDGITRWQQAVLAMADWIMRGRTAPRAEAVAMVLLGEDHQTNDTHARQFAISRQAVEAQLKGSGLDAMDISRGAFRGHDFDAAAR